MKFCSHLFCLSAIFAISLSASAQKTLLRTPAVNKDGSLVAFSFQGDIWTVPATGGRATRLTIHEAYESQPVFSPDGKQIAFSGARFGNDDIFIMPVEGGSPTRLTWRSAGDNIASWTDPNQIIFTSTRDFKRMDRPQEVYSISPKAGNEKRILDAVGFDPVYSPDGRFMAFVRGDINPVYRQEYRGSSNRDIWIYDTKNKTYFPIKGFTSNDIEPKWADNRSLYFLSSDAGTYNIYKEQLDENGKPTGNPQQLTHFKDEAIRSFSLSGDGKTIVYEKEMGLYLMKPGQDEGKQIPIQIHADDRFDAVEQKTMTNGMSGYSVSPNGKLLAFEIRGEVFVKEANKENSRAVNVSNHPFRDMDAAWLNDSSLLFTSDREGDNFDLYMVRSMDTSEVNIYKTLKQGLVRISQTAEDESSPVVSPDGKKIAFGRGKGKLVVANISATGTLSGEVVLTDGWDMPGGVAWSPDSKWLAYEQSDLNFNQEVFIQAADGTGKPVNVSMHPRSDGRPYWSPDGSKLGFISERNNLSYDIWFVWLKKADWEKSTQDWQEEEPEEASKEKGAKKTVKPVQIDFDGIYKRTVQVTSFPGNEAGLMISKDGETFYFTASNTASKGRDLYSIKWNGKELKELTKAGTNPGGLALDKDGKWLYYAKSGGSLARLDTKTGQAESLPYVAKMKVDYDAEREQIFSEAWRAIYYGFYDPNFHGHDWKALRKKYHDRCVYASTGNDFRDMFNYMLGELNASHMALRAGDRSETQNDVTGLLGVDVMPAADGMKVLRVIPGTAAAKQESQLMAGDVITAVNGQSVPAAENFYALFNGLSNEKIWLTVQSGEGKKREVVIRPQASISEDLYEEWVDDRKKLVDKWSNGRLGYIHIRSMDMPSFEETEREFTAAGYGKDGLVIDVRYNGGGSTTDYLMTVLNYKQHAYTIPRGAASNLEKEKLKFREHYPIGERLVFAAWTKSSIALCNEGSYSNAEIFSHAYKQLGIGKLVGQPTNGSVISTGARQLMDGSSVRLPGRGWYTKATDKNQELGPAVPDILVENAPDWNAKDTDAQLKAAVEELLKELK